MVAIVNTWSTSFTRETGFVIPAPAAQSLGMDIQGSGTPGNWLIAVVGWQQASTSTPVTFAVGDPSGSVWEPVGAPGGTSPDGGNTRVSVWATPNPGPVTEVFASPNGNMVGAALLVAEVSGLGPWITPGSVSAAFANSASAVGPLTSIPPASVPLNANTTFQQAAEPWAPVASPWTATGGSAIAATAAWGCQAQAALAVTAGGAAAPGAVSEMVPVTAAQRYTASFWALSVTGWAAGAQAVITWYNSSGTFLSATTGTAQPLTAANFTWCTASAAAPAGAAFATMTLQLAGLPPAGSVLYASWAVIGAASPALFITACASDADPSGLTSPTGSGWTTLPQVTGNVGTFITLASAWQVASAPATATWTGSGTQDLAALTLCVSQAGIAPAAVAQDWPLTRLQLGLGAGAQTPWDQIGWTDITPRYRGGSGSRGKQYELDVVEAGTHNWTIANNDGWLTPGSQLSPYFPYVRVYTPARLLMTWPPPPASGARTYSVVRHYMERFPQARTAARYQNSGGVSTDVWALLTPIQVSVARGELLSDGPAALWPCDDATGSVTAANLAPGGVAPLQVITSKYGAGSAVQQFQSNGGFLAGDASGASWFDNGIGTTTGYCLYSADPGLPPISGGVTIEGWFQLQSFNPTTKLALMTVRNSKGNVLQVYADGGSGNIGVGVYDKVTQAATFTVISPVDWLTTGSAIWFHVAVTFSQTSWAGYVDGSGAGAASGSCNFAASPWWMSVLGVADRIATGAFVNAACSLIAVFPQQLLANRILSHFIAGVYGFGTEEGPASRIDRLLGESGCAYPRVLGQTGYALQGALDISGNAVSQNVTNVAESDNGLLLVSGAGYLRYRSRTGEWNIPVSWTFGENVTAPANANYDFETGTGPWTATGGAVLSQSGAWSKTGSFSALITPNGSTASPGMLSEPEPVTPGVSYTAAAWAYSPQGWTTGAAASIRWLSAGGSLISTTTGQVMSLGAGQAAQVTAAARAPAGAASAQMAVAASGTPGSSVQILVDDAVLATTATEYPYGADFSTDYDPSQVFNDLTLTQEASPTAEFGAATGVTIAVASAASIAQYGDQTLQETIYTTPAQGLTDLANWIINTMGAPQTRIAQMTLDPSANPALWQVVLSLETGQVVQVNSRLRGELDISGAFEVMQLSPSGAPRNFRLVVTAIAYNGYVLTADDPQYGALDGVPRLAW